MYRPRAKKIIEHWNDFLCANRRIKLEKLKQLFRLLIKINSSVFHALVTIPPALIIIYVLKPFYKIRIGELESRVYGHFVLAVETYLSEIDVGINIPEKNEIRLFIFSRKISSRAVQNIWKKYFVTVPRVLFGPLFDFLNNYFPNSEILVPYRHWKHYPIWQTFDFHGVMPKTYPHLNFSSSEKLKLTKKIMELGVTKEDQVICFFSRDTTYYPNGSPRNSSIALQAKGILYLADLGYKCLRVGAYGSPFLNFEHPNIIDYANSKFVSQEMDLFVQSKAQFMISTGSGIDSVAHAYRKKCLYVNHLEWGFIDRYKNYQVPIFLPKLYYDTKRGRLLKLSEIKEIGAHKFEAYQDFSKLGLVVVDNTEAEIAEAIEEMLQRHTGCWADDDIASEMQNDFKALAFEQCKFPENIPNIGAKFLKRHIAILFG